MASVGVYADISGDDDGDATAWVEYRAAGSGSYMRGHDLMRIAAGRWAGAVFFLEPGNTYDVRVVLDDPDNSGQLTSDQTASTRGNAPAASTSELWVDAAAGKDSNLGTAASPFATIQAAADKAKPGDKVRVKPGVYRESIDPPTAGTEAAPIWFVAEGAGVVVDGSDPALEKPTWQSEGGGVYSTAFSGQSEYIAADDARLYDYQSLSDLQSAAGGLPGGFYVDSGASKLYVRMPDDSDPSAATFHVAVRDVGFLLDTISHVVVEGFELRYFGSTKSGVAVDIRDTHHAWVRNNTAHHMNAGYRVRRDLASENVIEGNSFRDTSVWTWPWGSVKAHTPEASAISITSGRGNVVRKNDLEGSFNGIDVGAFGTTDEAIAKDTEVYGNVMRQHGDDGLEPEGACVNVRFWHNAIIGVKNAISLAPIEVGPTWLVRNLVADYTDHVLKLNNGSKGWILVYHTTGSPAAGQTDAQAIEPSLAFGPFVSRNNIYQAHRYAIENGLSSVNAGVSLDYDALWTDDPARFVKWLGTTYADITALKASSTIEANGFEIEPKYVDTSKADYNLTNGHGLLDVGVEIPGINSQFIVGAGPDVGAFEKGGVSPWQDANPSGGAGGTGGTGGTGTGGGGAGGGAGQAGSGANAGAGGSNAGGGSGDDDGGCGCRVPASAGPQSLGWLSALLLFGAARRRRRSRR